MISIRSDWTAIELEFERLQHLPEGEAHRLDAALELAKEEIKASVHVLTGELQESTAAHSHSVPHIWEGEVTVGEGLGYAKYEQRRKGVKATEGTPHDFIEPNLHLMHEEFTDAMRGALKG